MSTVGTEPDRVFARGGHPGGSASTLRILRALRRAFSPTDIILSSKGHDASAFLIDGVERGDLDGVLLDSYRAVNGYPGHPERGVTPGAWVSTGSLGMGLSKAVGLAWAMRDRRVVCVVGDGESQEGQVWEALQNAARLDLRNLIVLFDHNAAQSDNAPLPRPNVLHPEGIFKAAGWAVLIADLDHQVDAFPVTDTPLCVLCHGVKPAVHSLGQLSDLARAYGDAIDVELEEDPRLVLLHADLAGDHGLTGLERRHPGRVLQCGISEQHMVSMGVGLAAAGWRPVLHTFERFFYRAAEQVLDAQQEPGLVLRYVAGLAGPLAQGPGRSHELPDAQRRALFPLQTFTPEDPAEVEWAVGQMLRQPRSTLLRLLAQPDLAFTACVS